MIEIEIHSKNEELNGKRIFHKNKIKTPNDFILNEKNLIEFQVKKDHLKFNSNSLDKIIINGKESLVPCVLKHNDRIQFSNTMITIIKFEVTKHEDYREKLKSLQTSVKKNPSLAKLIKKLTDRIDI